MKRYIKSSGDNKINLVIYRDFAEKILGEYIEDADWIASEYGLHQDWDDYNYWLSGNSDDIYRYIRDFNLDDYEAEDMWRISRDKYSNSYSDHDKPNMRAAGLSEWLVG